MLVAPSKLISYRSQLTPNCAGPTTARIVLAVAADSAELAQIEALLERGWELLRPGGRLAILSYHSLEDRIVKQFVRGEQEIGRAHV